MNSNIIKKMAESIKLTDKQRSIIVGTVLGDGCLESQNQGRTFRLKVEHSINQKDYVDWLYSKLQNLVLTKPQIKEQMISEKLYSKYWFSTISAGELRFYGTLFYVNHKKVIPKIINKLVTPLSLAIWFMDDGSMKSKHHSARILNTQGFDAVSIQRLQDMLLNKFHIKTTLRHQKDGTQIYVPATEVKKFIALIQPFIIPSMEYKIKINTIA